MWVRGMMVAVAVTCCAVTAQAAQYTEVWNPPEAAHAVKRGKGHTAVRAASGKVAAKGDVKLAAKGKVKRQQRAPVKKVASVHAGHQASPRLARHPASTHLTSTMASAAPRPAREQPVATMASTAARPAAQSSNLPPILH